MEGLAVCAVELNVPPPDRMDQAAVAAPPPKLAPLNVMAEGVTDWQAVFGPPETTVGPDTVIVTGEV